MINDSDKIKNRQYLECFFNGRLSRHLNIIDSNFRYSVEYQNCKKSKMWEHVSD